MAVSLYKKGDTHEVRGIKCEIFNCHHSKMDHYISEGYVKSPEELSDQKSFKSEVKKSDEAAIVATDDQETLELEDE